MIIYSIVFHNNLVHKEKKLAGFLLTSLIVKERRVWHETMGGGGGGASVSGFRPSFSSQS